MVLKDWEATRTKEGADDTLLTHSDPHKGDKVNFDEL